MNFRVYVDTLRPYHPERASAWGEASFCRLWTDPTPNNTPFRQWVRGVLGRARNARWNDRPDSLPHFTISPAMREKVVAAGAIQVGPQDILSWFVKWRKFRGEHVEDEG
jgi:hypothetical protein